MTHASGTPLNTHHGHGHARKGGQDVSAMRPQGQQGLRVAHRGLLPCAVLRQVHHARRTHATGVTAQPSMGCQQESSAVAPTMWRVTSARRVTARPRPNRVLPRVAHRWRPPWRGLCAGAGAGRWRRSHCAVGVLVVVGMRAHDVCVGCVRRGMAAPAVWRGVRRLVVAAAKCAARRCH